MNQKISVIFACAILLFAACSEDKTTAQLENTAPVCKLTSPVHGVVHDATIPLVIKGEASDAENNISVIRLTVGGKVVEEVTFAPFEYEIAPENLHNGTLSILLYVMDTGGLRAQDAVTIVVNKDVNLMVSDDGEKQLAFGYWTEERGVRVVADGKWMVSIPSDARLEFFDPATQQWGKKTVLTGQGETAIKIRSIANERFEERPIQLTITSAGESGVFDITQAASPDMIALIEDEMLRMAAGISIVMYGMDPNEDGKISAYEAELVPAEGQPCGFDAGAWQVATTKGIENFPQLRHLDVNSNPITEINLSRNVNLMSIHVHNCNNLKSLDLSRQTKLIELGSNYDIFLSVQPQINKLKTQIHTLGIFSRKSGQLSDLDFSGFTNMQRLYINDNGLTSLKLTGCIKLWRLVAGGNAFTELDLSEVDQYKENQYLMDNCPNLKKIYVWKGFTLDFYNLFRFDPGVQIIEK